MKPARPFILTLKSAFLRGLGLVIVLSITGLIALNKDRMKDFEGLGYAGAFLAMLGSNATLILPAPGLIIVFALGSSLNPIGVGLCGALGATLGELTGYVTGYSGLAIMEQSRTAGRIHRWMERSGGLTIFFLSIFPNPFFDLAGVLAGAGKMPIWKFQAVAFCGKLIQSTLIALAGALSMNWIEPWL
ncbi:MAG: VTT domain-containing protein [Chloroflexi bacterium]|nr:VTT domain-containing protein [Chloroflexota bacterium]